MTDKDKPSKVMPIFKGLKIKEEDKLEPIPEVVDFFKRCLEGAESGELREVCCVTGYYDKTFTKAILGVTVDFNVMQNYLRCMDDEYFSVMTFPLLNGIYYAEDLE